MSETRAGFSSDHAEASARFRELAARAGFELARYPISARGPAGEELAIDVAIRGPSSATRALVISSGLHGIEGYFGSAVQRAWLLAQSRGAALDRREVVIHGLNPFGLAWRRRVNEDNVDLNRNFLLAGQSFTGAHEGYRALDGLLNPASAPERFDPFLLKALAALAKSGFRTLKNAVAQGQYEYPTGLFYGGSAPSATQRVLRGQMGGWLGCPERALHIDLHTGRGAFGTYALCVDLPTEGARVAALKQSFGAASVEAFDPRGVLYEIRGGLGSWLEQLLPSVHYDCLLAEFGTYDAVKVLSALRYENRAHHYARSDVRLVQRAKAKLFEAFCPRAPRWRTQVLAKAARVLEQARVALR
jgi:hypothetical protein